MTVGKIIGVGMNYVLHAKELGSAIPKLPVLFLKPSSSLIGVGQDILLPKGADVHHEVIIGKEGKRIKRNEADNFVDGYAVALDMTARNFQSEAKKKGLPWSVAKGFDTFAPIGPFLAKNYIKDIHNLDLICKVNGELRQHGNTSDMLFNSIMRLERGDIILTGTPSGVNSVKAGDMIEIALNHKEKVLSQAAFKVKNDE